MDGQSESTVGWTDSAGAVTTGNNINIGQYDNYLVGTLDEVAIWNRALSANEVVSLYRRGASRLKVQVRAWDLTNYPGCVNGTESSGCPNFVGYDGTTTTYFTELTNSTTSPPNFSLSSMIGRYFQYKATFEVDSSGNSPDLTKVTVSQ